MNIFKFKKQEPVRVPIPEGGAAQTLVVKKSASEIIEEIHNSFYTEVEALLKDAKVLHSLETTKQDLMLKRVRLIDLGFVATAEVKEAEEELRRLRILETENAGKIELASAIEYFSLKYPTYKFITASSVKKICQKYGLIYGSVGLYAGTVPDVNLDYIETFRVDDEDACFEASVTYTRDFRISSKVDYINHKVFEDWKKKEADTPIHDIHLRGYAVQLRKSSLEIVAPKSDFDLTRMDIKDFQITASIQVPDPIVIQPVLFKGTKHYLVVTAWGKEALDKDVFNEKMN